MVSLRFYRIRQVVRADSLILATYQSVEGPGIPWQKLVKVDDKGELFLSPFDVDTDPNESRRSLDRFHLRSLEQL